jgi:hypothetical protein
MFVDHSSQEHHYPLIVVDKKTHFCYNHFLNLKWSGVMVGYERKFEISKSSIMQPDRQWIVITFKPNGYWSEEAIKVRAVVINKQGIEVSINNSMGGEAEYDSIARAESFHSAYGQAILDMKRIHEAFSSGQRDIDDIMNHVNDQHAIDQASR